MLQTFLKSLNGINDWNTQYAQIESWARQGEISLLVELANELEHGNHEASNVVLEPLFDRVKNVLSLRPGFEYAKAAIFVGQMKRRRTARLPLRDHHSNISADEIVASQTIDIILQVLNSYRELKLTHESIARLICSMVVRGIDCRVYPEVVNLHKHLTQIHHPLSILPLYLLRNERGLPNYMPRYAGGVTAYSLPFGPIEQLSSQKSNSIGSMHVVTKRYEDKRREKAVLEAVKEWISQSNGRYELAFFTTPTTYSDVLMGDVFLDSLGLESLAPTQQGKRTISITSAKEIFEQLFCAAMNGGAYGDGLGPSYGRLAAWISIKALGNVLDDLDFEAANEALLDSEWFKFENGCGWFDCVAWDLGIIVSNNKSSSLVVFALTDTD